MKFIKRYKTNKLVMFCSNEDYIQFHQKANVVDRITCPGCYSKYIGKTMKITTKGITTVKKHLINLITPIYFTNHQKRQSIDFLKEVSMHYFCEKLP